MENFLNYFKIKEDKLFSVSEIKNHPNTFEKLYLEKDGLFKVPLFDFCKSFELKEKYPNELLFTKQYSHLLSFCKISEKEDYFKEELLYYYENKSDTNALKEMIIKNKEICSDLTYSFLVNYQDDEEAINREYWLVGFNEYWDDSFYFKVCENEFLKTLEFLDVFYDILDIIEVD